MNVKEFFHNEGVEFIKKSRRYKYYIIQTTVTQKIESRFSPSDILCHEFMVKKNVPAIFQ
jgi:hypothetical protein